MHGASSLLLSVLFIDYRALAEAGLSTGGGIGYPSMPPAVLSQGVICSFGGEREGGGSVHLTCGSALFHGLD